MKAMAVKVIVILVLLGLMWQQIGWTGEDLLRASPSAMLRARAWGERELGAIPSKNKEIAAIIKEYRNALRPYILTDDQRTNLYNSKGGELRKWVDARNADTLRAYYTFFKGLIDLTGFNPEDAMCVYPFSGADAVPAATMKTFIFERDAEYITTGVSRLADSLNIPEIAISGNIINLSAHLDAMRIENYTLLNNPNHKHVLILKGFRDYAGRNLYYSLRDENQRKEAIYTLLRNIFGCLQEGDVALILYKDDIDCLREMGLINSQWAIELMDFKKHGYLSFDSASFIIPNVLLYLTKRDGILVAEHQTEAVCIPGLTTMPAELCNPASSAAAFSSI